MISTIILIAAFQFYWINRLYKDEWQNLRKETDVIFRDVTYRLQLQRFRSADTLFGKGIPDNLFFLDVMDSVKENVIDSVMTERAHGNQRHVVISITGDAHHDSMNNEAKIITQSVDTFNMPFPPPDGAPGVLKYFSNNKTLNDSLPLYKIDSAYKAELIKNGITLSFAIKSFSGKENELHNTIKTDELKTNFTFVGLSQAHAYQAEFANPFNYILNKIKLQVLFSLLLLTITMLSFIFLYRNLVNQRRLAAMKNEFISNITHELKTPIATVSVAIEALRSFNASLDPQKTKEYLDISSNELQRLSLLVDKVLKLSMFEKKAVELQYETLDMKELVGEVTSSMRLQFEKHHAQVNVSSVGDTSLEGDRLHLVSVIFNLIDNAIKYSPDAPKIDINMIGDTSKVNLIIRDSGIGIPQEYQNRIFEKFFRVPTGNLHNAKGYGLGLSYVSHVISRHNGTIDVKSIPDDGSEFSISLPKYKS